MEKKVKICGLTNCNDINISCKAGADFVGFVFYPPSPRNLSLDQFSLLAESVAEGVKIVGVFVDPTDIQLKEIMAAGRLDYIQLHGKETRERVKKIKSFSDRSIIKAFSVRCADDINIARSYDGVVDMVLFDAKVPESGGLPGGNGVSFDWHLLKSQSCKLPWILSGGLTVENVKEALHTTGAEIVDVSTGVEINPGEKDPKKIRAFINNVKH